MKGYKEPEKFEQGICFICMEKCDKNAYCHYECALAYSEEKGKRIIKSREKE